MRETNYKKFDSNIIECNLTNGVWSEFNNKVFNYTEDEFVIGKDYTCFIGKDRKEVYIVGKYKRIEGMRFLYDINLINFNVLDFLTVSNLK